MKQHRLALAVHSCSGFVATDSNKLTKLQRIYLHRTIVTGGLAHLKALVAMVREAASSAASPPSINVRTQVTEALGNLVDVI